MAKLVDALKEAAAVAQAEEKDFNAAVSPVLSKIKRGATEVKKSPELLAEVPADANAWEFLLRVASEKPTFAKQAWEYAVLLLEKEEWAQAFAGLAEKHRLNFAKAGARDVAQAAELIAQLLRIPGIASLEELLPVDAINASKPALCAGVVEALTAEGFPDSARLAAFKSDSGIALQAKVEATAQAPEEKTRKVIGPATDQKTFGAMPVYVCEGISGSHQNMEIKKGL